MLVPLPLEIIDLVENVYSEDGDYLGIKIPDDATLEQKRLFKQHLEECESVRESLFKIKISGQDKNLVDK